MAVFRESPIIGWGFTNRFFSFADGHVGNQSMLLNGGILGYSIWMLIFALICMKTLRSSRIPQVRARLGNGGVVFFFGLLATFVIHSSSMQMWGYPGTVDGIYYHWSFLFAAANAYLVPVSNVSPINS